MGADPATSDTVAAERRAFLRRLRTEPRFLWRHVPALSAAVFRRLRNRLIIALAAEPHRGRKRRADWAGAGRAAARSSCLAVTHLDLPSYPALPSWAASEIRAADAIGEVPGADAADPEDHFARHRWNFLRRELLQEQFDWCGSLAQCSAWVAAHADRRQAYWEPYSAAERVRNLCVFLASVPAEPGARQLPPDLVRFLRDSIDWIGSRLEYYGPRDTNNHILADAAALAVGGVVIGDDESVDAAIDIFRHWLPRLVQPEGFLRERSSHYQLIALNWLLDAWQFVTHRRGRQSDGATLLCDSITRMLAAAGMVCDRAGMLLDVVGDISPDASTGQSALRLARLYPDSWPIRSSPRPTIELRDDWFRISGESGIVLGNFPPGPFPPAFPTHGHCDFTSFCWRHGDTAVLVDRGRYRYTGDSVSLSQLSAASHNLPTVNGYAPLCESLVANGQWWPRPYALAALEIGERDGGLWLAHSGFARITPVRRHSRLIQLCGSRLVVQDVLEGLGGVELDCWWNFGLGFGVFDRAQNSVCGAAGQVLLEFEGLASQAAVTAIRGAIPGGWMSEEYGQKMPALTLRVTAHVRLPVTVVTRFEVLPPVDAAAGAFP